MCKTSEKLRNYTILYVEDEDIIRTNVAKCLNYVCHVVSAKNGQEGLEKFIEEDIDLIITDIEMPIKNGIVMLEEISKIEKNIPCIITTALNSNVEYPELCRYISKPFDMKRLLQVTIELLEDLERV